MKMNIQHIGTDVTHWGSPPNWCPWVQGSPAGRGGDIWGRGLLGWFSSLVSVRPAPSPRPRPLCCPPHPRADSGNPPPLQGLDLMAFYMQVRLASKGELVLGGICLLSPPSNYYRTVTILRLPPKHQSFSPHFLSDTRPRPHAHYSE